MMSKSESPFTNNGVSRSPKSLYKHALRMMKCLKMASENDECLKLASENDEVLEIGFKE